MDAVLVYINGTICAGIAARIFFFSALGHRHRPIPSLISWVLFVASSYVMVRCYMGDDMEARPEEILIHLVLLIALITRHGNVCRVIVPHRHKGTR